AKDNSLSIDFRSLLHPKEKSQNPNGIRLYTALFRLGTIFVTTNYDQWLDEHIPVPASAVTAGTGPAATAKVDRIEMNVIHRVEDLSPSLLSRSNTVVHLHGSLLNPEGMILTTHQYLEHYANDRVSGDAHKENRVLTFLQHLFTDRTVLFIGYGLE